MAPEFQLLRSDGTSYDRLTYLGALPRFQKRATISNLKVTGQGDLMVATYTLTTKMMVRNKPVAELAPRISVFRRSGTAWQMVAHANFAKIG